MKKFAILLALMMLLTAAAAEHIHTPGGLVDMDLNERWDVCECGEMLNITQHDWTVDAWGDKLCSICGAQQYLWDDGTLELCGMDAQGSIVRQISWNAEGELVMNLSTTYQYDEAGHVVSAWYYEDGVLFSESEFALDAEGYEYEVRSIVYEEDGSMSVSEYNEQGDQTLAEYYYAGELESALRFDYTYDAAGNITSVRTYSEDALIEEADYLVVEVDGVTINYPAKLTVWYEDDTCVTYITDENGDTLSETTWDAAGNQISAYTYESEYDENGTLIRVSTCESGVLILVEEYAVDAEGWNYLAVETVYNADGTTTVTRYDENGEAIK
ncbi:MAG: hypothetical protein IJA83_04430 [Clostridia bacterium]|nr:hypothetical protein [Clostridia bacterium]